MYSVKFIVHVIVGALFLTLASGASGVCGDGITISYVDSLKSYQGSAYLDVTCSQLICKAHNRISSVKYNCLAAGLWTGCGNALHFVTAKPSIASVDERTLLPGDIAVVSANHTLAYLGNGEWIDSDPQYYGVKIFRLSERINNDIWIHGEVRIFRWMTKSHEEK